MLKFKTKVVMMCGCPTAPGGLWDSSKFTMKALLKKDGNVVQKMPLTYSGETSIYKGRFKLQQKGSYKMLIYAFDPRTENSGVDVVTVGSEQ